MKLISYMCTPNSYCTHVHQTYIVHMLLSVHIALLDWPRKNSTSITCSCFHRRWAEASSSSTTSHSTSTPQLPFSSVFYGKVRRDMRRRGRCKWQRKNLHIKISRKRWCVLCIFCEALDVVKYAREMMSAFVVDAPPLQQPPSQPNKHHLPPHLLSSSHYYLTFFYFFILAFSLLSYLQRES